MDPHSVAIASVGLVAQCAKLRHHISKIETIEPPVRALLSEIASLEQVLHALTTRLNDVIVETQTEDQAQCWRNIKRSMEDCEVTLASVEKLLEDVEGLGWFLRHSLTQTRLEKEKRLLKEQVKAYRQVMHRFLTFTTAILDQYQGDSRSALAFAVNRRRFVPLFNESRLLQSSESHSAQDSKVVEDCRSSIQQMASSVEANRRRRVELKEQFQKLRDARLEDLYRVSGQRSQLPDAPAPARFMSVPSLGKVSEHVDGLTKSSQPRSQPTDRLPAASQTTSSISDETDFPTAPKRETGEQDKDTHAQETTLPADNIPASLDTSKASLPLNEQEMPLEVAKATYYSQTTFRPIDDVEVVLKTFEPLAAKQKIRETTEVISVLLADINEIDCFSGFDQRLPDATFLKSDDETFFTGTREVIWLESSELSLDEFERLVDRVAEKVRPFPVIGFDPRTNTIMTVHDQYFVSYNAATIQSPSGSSSKNGTVESSSNCQRTTSVSPTNSSSATSVGGGTSCRGSGKDVSPPPPPPPVSGENPEDQLSLSAACHICPFSGVFTIEDQARHEQCVKITFCLRINSSVNGRRILTTTALTDFSLSLPAPGELQEPSSRDPLSPYFVCNELQIAIGPDSEQISECEPRSRTPKGRWDVKKVSRSSGLTGGITVALAFLPSVQLPVSKKNGLAVDLDPISQFIDFKLAKSYEVRKTREHLWKYPLRKDRPKDNDLELPAHSSELGYRTSVNVESIHARVTATHVVDPKSRTANKLKRQNVEERRRRRAQSQPFKFEGDSKHLILQFTVTVKKRDGERFLQFEGPGVERSLYHKVGSHCSRREHAANTREQSPPDRRNSSESEDVSQAEGMLSMKWAK